jgi:hypothetical protein
MTDPHRRARRLLSDRMDADPTATDATWLAEHLAGCARCRSVDRAYADAQRSLRALRPTVPPRDLGARISAGLDAELRRGSRFPAAGLPAPPPRVVALAVMGSIAVCVIAFGSRFVQAQPGPATRQEPRLGAPVATPFAVPDVELALVDVGTEGLTVYQASTSLVCPSGADDDCATAAVMARMVSGVPRGFVPRDLSLDRGSRRLALVAEDAMGVESVSVLVLPPMDLHGSDEPRGLGRGPDGQVVGLPGGQAPQLPTTAPPGDGMPSLDPRGQPQLTAILDDVEAVGAPPAWSPDGQMLAFSAMPSDRSRGPDVYVWRSGDPRAHRITDDRASWFASWSGARLVVNRVQGEGARRTATTHLVDPLTKRSQVAPLDSAWLPAVDPSGRFAVAWRGSIAGNGPIVRPRTGELVLVDWTLVDPAASGGAAQAIKTASAANEAVTRHRARNVGGTDTTTRARPRVARSDVDPDAGWLEPVEPGGSDVDPVLDWQVSWAASGTTFGYWVADANGAAWGRLTVLRVLSTQRRIDRGEALLGPTLARRSFTLGVDRVAWVAPAAEGADGELRVRTWTESGEGSLRLAGIRVRHGIPAF